MDLKVKLFADGADKKGIVEMYENPLISGFTTNPTLMKSAGIKDYKEFSKDILGFIKDKPVSLEVFSDNFNEMENQALEISSWGENVNVKIPITNTKSESSLDLIKSLSKKGVKLNVTAIMTIEQIEKIISPLKEGPGGYVSVFAGRIADSGKNPLITMKKSLEILADDPKIELIWASPRELYNVVQANDIGCHIITATNDILRKLPTLGKNLDQFSLETVKMFYDDAVEAGYSI